MLKTRKPTGRIPFPLVLVEGEEKSGRSYALAQLAASGRVGRCFYLELGDGVLDQYAPLGDFDLLVHDGTWVSIIGQLRDACAEPSDPNKPNVVGVDSGTAVWFLLKSWTDRRARNSKTGRAKLDRDPDAEIDPTTNLWNDAKSRWGEMIHLLQEFPGIGLLTAWGHEVARMEDGAPTKDRIWTVEAEKNTVGAVSAWVRMKRPHAATLIGVRSLSVVVPEEGLVLPEENMLDHLVFEVIGAGTTFTPSTAVAPEVGIPILDAKSRLLDAVQAAAPSLTPDEAKAEAGRLWLGQGWPNGQGEVRGQDVDALIRQVGAPPAPRSAPDPGPPAPSGLPAGPEVPAGPPVATGPPGAVELDGQTFGSTDLALRWLNNLRKPEAVVLATKMGLATNGKLADIVVRIAGARGLLEGPFDPPEGVGEKPHVPTAEPQAPGPDDPRQEPPVDPPPSAEPDPGPELPEVREVPPGWQEGLCLCGEPLMFQPGNVTATIQHLSPELDAEHPAEEVF